MRKRLVALAAVVLAGACGTPPRPKPVPHVAPSASASASSAPSASASVAIDPHFREHEPALGPEPTFAMPRLRTTRLANGMRVMSASTGGGMFAMRMVFEGYAAFPSERPAVAQVMLKALFGGTPTRDAHELRRVLEKRFAAWGVYTTPDALMIDMTMPDDDVRPCVDVMADVVQHPNFDSLTIGFELLQLVEQGQTARESPSIVGDRTLMRALYGASHGYARPPTVLEGNANVDQAEVRRVYQAMMNPQNATIVLAGAVERPILDHVERMFGSWHMTGSPSPAPLAPITWKGGPRLVVVDRPGSPQSQITFGGLAPARSSADFYPMVIINELLGAHRTSRLTQEIVEHQAASSSGSTTYDARRGEGAFYWDSSVPVARTAAILAEIDKQFSELGRTPPPAAELDGWKARYVRNLPLVMETAHQTAEVISSIPVYKLGDGALDDLVSGIRAVTPDTVKSVAAARLGPDRTRAVVVGDWAQMKKDLKALGWGPIEIRDATGKVLRVEK